MIRNLVKMSIDLSSLKQIQIELAQQVQIDDQLPQDIKYIGGTDIGFTHDGAMTRAAIVILHYPELTLAEYQVAHEPTTFPYIPGYLSFREYPALLSAWQQLSIKPDLLLVDGQGIAHPRRLGIASHLGLLLDVATIGVAKKRLWGQYDDFSEKMNYCVLHDKNEQIGWVLQSKVRCNPLFISPGHKVSISTSLQWVINCLRGYRLPEPTRWADAVASKKPLFIRYLQQNSNIFK